MTNLLGFGQRALIPVPPAIFGEDFVILIDGSGSIGSCEFKKAKEALKHMMTTLSKPGYDSKFAAVTFSDTASVNFKFLPSHLAASEITKISYPGGLTNTQAALAEAKKLFDDPYSGILCITQIVYP